MDGKRNVPAKIGTYSANIKGLCVCVLRGCNIYMYLPLCCIVKVKNIKILASNPIRPSKVESSTVPPKLPKKWAAAAASRYPVMVAATCKYLEQDCTMIVQ